MKQLAKRLLPARVWDGLRVATGRATLAPPRDPAESADVYEALYETHARTVSGDDAIGGGDFDLVGRISLSLMLQEGLQPHHTLVDLGCGIGRLAVHAAPALTRGHYIGIDISQTMLDRAQARMAQVSPTPTAKTSWIKQTTSDFPLESGSVDRMVALSVFTHMEHEDAFRYLKDARRIMRDGGRFLFSCLPMSLPVAREIFLSGASLDFKERWNRVRSITTTVELMETLAVLAGWRVVGWHPGDQPTIKMMDSGELVCLGQSVCVVEVDPART